MHVTTIWMLTPFTDEKGTLIIPGTHRQSNNPTGYNGINPSDPHPDEIEAEGEPGSVLVMDSPLWHAITPNRSNTQRVAMPIRFAPWWLNLDSLWPGLYERARLTEGGLLENLTRPFLKMYSSDCRTT